MTTQERVLITGGSTGIGLGLARRFLQRGAAVTVTGRSAAGLESLVRRTPGLRAVAGDLASPEDRERLVVAVGPVDVLINNAGIQRRVALAADEAPWPERQHEIDLLLAAPVHLTSMLVPGMLERARGGTIVDVTSAGAFVPQPFAPVYSAAKAALHSWTVNLRHALAGTGVRVVELIPPAVATGLSGEAAPHGADVDEFCDAAMAGLDSGAPEVGFGPTATADFLRLLDADRSRFEVGVLRFSVDGYAPRGDLGVATR